MTKQNCKTLIMIAEEHEKVITVESIGAIQNKALAVALYAETDKLVTELFPEVMED